jgi:NADP-dependent 3-hydroxy acid dehydrogenase YdfG
MDVRGKHVWLVGASAGIGAALAKALAAAGATLTLSARNAELLRSIAAACSGPTPQVLPLDVTDSTSVAAAWNSLNAAALPDMVIYNAGTYEPLAATQFDLTKIEQMMEVNFHGCLRVLSHVIPAFVARNHGHIALVGSVAGYRGLPGAEAASRRYFRKSAARLSPREAALLAAILPSPRRRNPAHPTAFVSNYAASIERRMGGVTSSCVRSR